MPGIGLGMSPMLGLVQSGYDPATDTDANLLATGRSALTIPASVGTTPTILPAHLSITHENKKVFVADNGALDIGAQSFTFCMWLRNDLDYSGYWFWGGKSVAGNKAGMYDFVSYVTTGNIRARAQTSTGVKEIISTTPATPGTWLHLRMDINIVTSKMRFFINNVQVGSDLSFTGTFTALSNEYEFILASQSAANGSSITGSAKCSISDVWIFHKVLSDAEALTIYNRGMVSGSAAHYPLMGASGLLTTIVKNQYDASGNGLHLTCDSASGYEVLTSDFKYNANGSRHGLDVGYTLYENATNQIYVPLSDVGAELVSPPGLTGYTKVANFAGNSTFHNLANSKIAFTESNWDRSNTTNWRALARAATTYYDSTSAATKKYWHITELSNLHLTNWSNANYEALNFVKISDNSYGTRRKLEEILSFTANKSSANADKVLIYCLDLNLTQSKSINLSTTQGAIPLASAIGLIIASGKYIFITWDDGSFEKFTADGVYGAKSHTHTTANTEYTVRVMGDLEGITKFVIADTLMNVDLGEFGKASSIEWIGSGVTRTQVGDLDKIPATLKEIWFRYPTIDGAGVTGNLNLKPLLEAFEMQGGTTAAQKWVKEVTGDFENLSHMKSWCCVTKVKGDISGLKDIEYFSFSDYYNQAIITGDISDHIHLYSFEAQAGSDTVTGNTELLVNMEQFKTTPAMTKPASISHMPKLSSFTPVWGLIQDEVNQYLADIWANREVVRTHYLNTVGTPNGTGFRYLDLTAHASTPAPTGQGITDRNNLRITVSPASPGNGVAWTVLTK